MTGRNAAAAVVLVLVVGSLAGGALAAPGAGETSDRLPGVAALDGTAPGGASPSVAPAVVDRCRVPGVDASQQFVEACERFNAANESVRNASAALNGTADRISAADEYSATAHADAQTRLDTIETGLARLDRAFRNITSAVVTGELTPTQRFVVLEAFETRSDRTETVASASVSAYEDAIAEKRSASVSTVSQYFGGATIVGLVLGLVLGAFVPVREARNVTEQMKLSSNVSYNRRAGLVPLTVGVVLTLLGLGVLWFVGAVDVIGVLL